MADTLRGDYNYTGTIVFSGTVTMADQAITNAAVANAAAIARSKLAQDNLAAFPIPWADFRVWDAYGTNLPATPATDDLGLVGGTFGSASPSIQAGDLKAAGLTTRYARVFAKLPESYVDGETVNVRVRAGMLTTVADTTCTADIECYESNKEAGISADLCTTAAQSMNSLTFANLDFTITPTALAAGNVLDIRITIACNDAATATAVTPCIGSVEILADIKG